MHRQITSLFRTTIHTPLGDMLATADHTTLHTLEFTDNPKPFAHKNKSIMSGTNPVLELLKQELAAYFAETLTIFTVPLYLEGTDFQKQTWQQLSRIAYGSTINYAQLAQAIDKPTAYRAVANANRANRIALLIPCHRVITSTGDYGGYRYNIERKRWLLDHEKQISLNF